MSKAERAVADLERCPHCGATIEIYSRSCPICGRDVVAEKAAVIDQLHDTGAISASVYKKMRQLLAEPDLDTDEAALPSPIRKQVTALVPDDLERFPIWEFALDEEGEEGPG